MLDYKFSDYPTIGTKTAEKFTNKIIKINFMQKL